MEDLDILENSVDIGDFADDDEPGSSKGQQTPIQAPKATKKKRTPTPKQLEVLEKAREKMLTNAREKRMKKQLEDEAIENEIQRRVNAYKKGIEEKIIRKAIAVKKREIMKQSALDDITDDDTPMEKVYAKVAKVGRPEDKKKPKPNSSELEEVQQDRSASGQQPPAVKKYIFV